MTNILSIPLPTSLPLRFNILTFGVAAMQFLNSILTWVMKKRIHQMELFMKYPHEVQDDTLKKLIATARDTEFGRLFSFDDLTNYEDFKRRVPVHTYEQLFPFIERILQGQQNILWPSEIK